MMLFANPWFLVGLAAAAVPILIHLLTRDRVRRVSFSTVRFFVNASRKVLRKKRFRELVLLAMRVGVFALLALAFARPLLQSRQADATGPEMAETARVLLVDLSASMARAGAAETLRREARSALDECGPGDVMALVTFAEAPRVEVPLTGNVEAIRRRIDTLAPGHGGTDVAEALRKADAALRGTKARAKEIVLVSDLQRAGWRDFKGDWKLAADTRLAIRPVAPSGDGGNLAIVEADYPASTALDGLPRTVAVRVANFSDVPRRDVEVALTVAGKKLDVQKVNLRPGDSVPVRFRHVFDQPGDNPGTLTVAATDAVAGDNVFYFNARVIPRIRVAILSGPAAGQGVLAPSGAAAQDPAFFLQTALAPTPESPFLVKRVPAAQATAADFADAMVAVVADVGGVSEQVAKALEGLLARGGGILFLPGRRTDAQAFGRVFGGVAPCKLRSILRPGARVGDAPGAVLTKVDFEHPVFEVFQHPHYGDLSLPRFLQFWEVGDSQLCRVLARFSDGRPAVLEREMGGGVSMMLTSPPDLRWNNLPLRAVFLPFIHQTVRYLAVRSEKRTGYRVGETLPVPDGAAVTGPAGKTLDSESAVATVPGFYTISGGEPFQFAVNRDPAEADPATMPPDEIVAAIQQPEGAIAAAVEAAAGPLADAGRDEGGFWWYVVVAVLGLSVAELFLANRTLRH